MKVCRLSFSSFKRKKSKDIYGIQNSFLKNAFGPGTLMSGFNSMQMKRMEVIKPSKYHDFNGNGKRFLNASIIIPFM